MYNVRIPEERWIRQSVHLHDSAARCGHPTSIAEARDIIERYLEKAGSKAECQRFPLWMVSFGVRYLSKGEGDFFLPLGSWKLPRNPPTATLRMRTPISPRSPSRASAARSSSASCGAGSREPTPGRFQDPGGTFPSKNPGDTAGF